MDTTKTALVQNLLDRPVELASLLDQLPLAVALLDPERRVIFMNHAMENLTGFSMPEILGLRSYHVLRSNLAFDLTRENAPDAADGAVSGEGDILNRSRKKVPVRITLAPLRDSNGRTRGYVEAVEDLRISHSMEGNLSQGFSFSGIVGRSPEMEKVFQIMPVIAQNDSSVLITGETGTGKDLLAEAIHQSSGRGKGPFIKVNCGALPESLLESELFGHQKGAFTGAVDNKPGWFRLAHKGSLFLTEIGDLPLALQVKLLTFLDDQVIYPLGSTKGVQVNVRIIAATHRNLEQMVEQGSFRRDLLFRLNVIRLHLPPLRERGEDIRLLIDHFVQILARRFKRPVKSVSREAMNILLDYHYPGNVRELRNILEYALALCVSGSILPEHLPAYMKEMSIAPSGEAPEWERVQQGQRAVGPDENLNWDEVEKGMILDALVRSRGKKSRAADLLGWGRSTMWRKMKKYGIG